MTIQKKKVKDYLLKVMQSTIKAMMIGNKLFTSVRRPDLAAHCFGWGSISSRGILFQKKVFKVLLIQMAATYCYDKRYLTY